MGFDVLLTGFEPAEVDIIFEGIGDESDQPENQVPEEASGPPVSRLDDVWMLGKHLLVCGDSTDAATYKLLMDNEKAEFVFTDPPYNVKIDGHVSGLGRVKHREFAMASGEMSEGELAMLISRIISYFQRHRRPAATRPRLPAPVQFEPGAMPTDNGVRPHDRQRIANFREQPIETDEYHSVDGAEGEFLWGRSPQNVDLLP